MPVNRKPVLLLLCVICSACVELFEPVLKETQEVMVISGMISDKPGRHTLSVSKSAPYRTPIFQPVEQCVVTVTDQEGNMIHYTDEGEGIYSADIPDEYLDTGDAISVHVVTPDMKEYRSFYDTILPCPLINSVYWEFQYMETNNPEKNLPGIQFYLDMSGASSDSRNLLWQVEETWEYWASLIGTHRWWEGWWEEFRSNPLYKCWKSFPLQQFYTGTTRQLSSNTLQRVALNYVSNETDRLSITYSLLVKQQSLSRSAYDYFQRMDEQADESGGLYDRQHATVTGNLYSVHDPEELVLGYFHASQVWEQRIFVQNNNFFEFNIPHISCEYQPLSVIAEWEKIEYPVYIYTPGPFQPSYTGEQFCFDCRIQGGDTIKPEYWESWK